MLSVTVMGGGMRPNSFIDDIKRAVVPLGDGDSPGVSLPCGLYSGPHGEEVLIQVSGMNDEALRQHGNSVIMALLAIGVSCMMPNGSEEENRPASVFVLVGSEAYSSKDIGGA